MNKKMNISRENLVANIENFDVTEIGERNANIDFYFDGNSYFYELFSLIQNSPIDYQGKIYGSYKPRVKDQTVYLYIKDADMSKGKQFYTEFDVIGTGKSYLIELIKCELESIPVDGSMVEKEFGISLQLLRILRSTKTIYTFGILSEHLKEYLQKHEGDKEAIEDIILDWDYFIVDVINKVILYEDKDSDQIEFFSKSLSEWGKTWFTTKAGILTYIEKLKKGE